MYKKRKNEKNRDRERKRGSGETREEKHEIYQKPEGVQRVSTALHSIPLKDKPRRGDFLSLLDKFKLDWPCIKLNLWGSLRLREESTGRAGFLPGNDL